jgi:GNAT superfamily N-acetyltransferase
VSTIAATAVDWADIEGWNPGLDDAQRFAAADPGAFMATEVDGDVLGTVSCALYGDAYAFVGFYIVREDCRGRGIGTALFDRALARAGDRVVGLDGVLEQQEVYASLGFELAHRNERWAGSGGGAMPAEVERVGAEDVLEYDRGVFGAPREAFLRSWLPDGALAVRRDGKIAGYGALRRAHEGFKIGPLFADDDAAAALLLGALRAQAGEGEPVFLDVPLANPGAAALAHAELDLPVFQTLRMYRGGRPLGDVGRVYGVTSFEFG